MKKNKISFFEKRMLISFCLNFIAIVTLKLLNSYNCFSYLMGFLVFSLFNYFMERGIKNDKQ